MAAGNLVELVRASTSNYFVEQGGEVADIGSDTVKEVTQFLFDLLVGGGPLDAYQWHIEDDDNVDLSSEIVTALDQIEVLVRGDELFARHPVARERPIAGLHVTHTPSFSQRNGHLYVFDHVDLGGTQPTKIKERAGFMGYMFSDIRAAEPSAVAYSIVRPPQANSADAIDYARIVLGSESTIINWQDDKERGGFLEERRRVAFDQAA